MWIRYHKEDRTDISYNEMLVMFFEQFPERYNPNIDVGHQTLSSRIYRDNDRPWLDSEGRIGFDEKGHLKLVPSGVRTRSTAEGREIDFPFTLVDKWPALVLFYEWKSPIREEDKERARRILAGDDSSDPHGSMLIHFSC